MISETDTLTDAEAADVVISKLKSKGFDVVSRENIIADIHSIRNRKTSLFQK